LPLISIIPAATLENIKVESTSDDKDTTKVVDWLTNNNDDTTVKAEPETTTVVDTSTTTIEPTVEVTTTQGTNPSTTTQTIDTTSQSSSNDNTLTQQTDILNMKTTELITNNQTDENKTTQIMTFEINITNDSIISDTSLIYTPVKVEEYIGNITSGDKKKIIIEEEKTEKTSIQTLSFTTSKTIEKVTFIAETINEKPEEIINEPVTNGSVYLYLDLKITSNETYLSEEEFELITIEFKVNKSWIINNQIDKSTIKMKRYHDIWEILPTTLISEDETHIYFEAETPGFSTYTIVGNKMIETSPSIVEQKSELPVNIGIIIIIAISITLLIMLFKSRFIYKETKFDED
jgi:PGF-pre-PGF domain-containing protein